MKPSVLEIRRVEAQEQAVERLEAIEAKIEAIEQKIDLLAAILERLANGAKAAPEKPVSQKKGEG